MVHKAEEYIKGHVNEPFFMYYALNTPHYPLQPLEKWRTVYNDLPMPRRDYAAFVSTSDEMIGKLLAVLDRTGLRERTIIMYLSDQGHSCEERTFGGGGYAGPYRGCKFSLFEGGIRVPAIISWEGNLPEGGTVDQVCHSMDILPTLAALAGIQQLPEGVEGRNISQTINNNAPSEHEILYWQLDRQWAVRKGNWKLIGNPLDPANPGSIDEIKDSLFLINLETDISESTNLAESEPEKLKELMEEFSLWKHANGNNYE